MTTSALSVIECEKENKFRKLPQQENFFPVCETRSKGNKLEARSNCSITEAVMSSQGSRLAQIQVGGMNSS